MVVVECGVSLVISTKCEVNVGNEAYSPFDHFATTLSSAPTARWRAEFDGVPEDTGR